MVVQWRQQHRLPFQSWQAHGPSLGQMHCAPGLCLLCYRQHCQHQTQPPLDIVWQCGDQAVGVVSIWNQHQDLWCWTYPKHNPEKTEEQNDHHNHGDVTIPPVRDLVRWEENDASPGVQDLGERIHAREKNAASRVITASLADDIGPAEKKRIDDVGGARKVEREYLSAPRHIRNEQNDGGCQLECTGHDAHRNSSSCSIDKHGG